MTATLVIPHNPGTAPATVRTRSDWVDYGKGIGIVLVVFGHVWRGVHAAGLPLPERLFEPVDAFIYGFHMPLFFFLSGAFASRSAGSPASRFLADKGASLVYPYVLWSFLQGGVNVALSAHTNSPLTFSELVRDVLYRPYAQFWFLYVLALITLLFRVLYRSRVTPAGIFALAAAGYGALACEGIDPPGVLRNALVYFPYFALGSWLGPRLAVALPGSTAGAPAAVAVLCPLLVAAAVADGRPSGLAPALVIALIGIAGVLAASALLDRSRGFEPLRRLGVASMPIYLAHVLGLSGCRIVLLQGLHVRSIPVHLAAGTVAGLALPLLLWSMVQRTGWFFFFTLKRPRSSQG